MRGKVAKKLNKLARLLELSKAERRKLKKDYKQTVPRSLPDLKERIARVEGTIDSLSS